MTTTWQIWEAGLAQAQIGQIEARKASLVVYLRMKLEAGDWHAVQDAASDIRELDAKLELLKDGK